QLFSDGRVSYFYSTNMQNVTTTPIVGVCQANGISPIPAATNLAAGSVGVSTSQFVYQTFPTVNTFQAQLAGKTVTFIPNAGGGYDVSTISCVPASNSNYGTGCYDVAHESFYENFASVGAFDLANNSLTLTPTGTGYAVTLGGGTFVAPVSPTVLVLG